MTPVDILIVSKAAKSHTHILVQVAVRVEHIAECATGCRFKLSKLEIYQSWGDVLAKISRKTDEGIYPNVLDSTILCSADLVGRVSNRESIPFRPPLPESECKIDFRLVGLMKEAWHEDPNSRPDIAAVKAKLSLVNKGK